MVFLADWSILAVPATNPLLLGLMPMADPMAVPSWPICVFPKFDYCYRPF